MNNELWLENIIFKYFTKFLCSKSGFPQMTVCHLIKLKMYLKVNKQSFDKTLKELKYKIIVFEFFTS